MTEQASAAPAASEAAPVVSAPNLEGGESFTAEQAFEAYQKRNSPAESAETATAGTESAVEADAAPEGTTAEDKGAEPEVPAIEPPRSWSKDAHERWSKLDRETQEFLASRDSEDQKAIKRGLNEAAEERKAAKAERDAAAQERKALAAKLPEVQRAIHEFLADKYPDIKSMDDVSRIAREAERLSSEDPFTAIALGNRLKAWEVDQRRIQLAIADAQEAQAGEMRDREANLLRFRADETTKLAEFVPEINNPDELKTLTTKAMNHLKDFDFTDQHLNEFAAQGEKPFIFSAGFQRILLNSMKYEEMKAAPAKAIPKPVPNVQKPGVARAPGAASADAIQATRNKLNGTGSVEDAFALYQAKKSRAR